jgi:hypothetical protein
VIYTRTVKIKKDKSLLIWLAIIFVGYVLHGTVFHDPDFGWHIRAGQVILQSGIPYTDPFSYSMPSFLFVDHEWLTNVVLSKAFAWFGIFPLTVFFSLLAVAAVGLQLIRGDRKWLSVPLFVAAGTLFDFVGVRPQVITWLFVSVLITVLFEKRLWQKWRFFLPFLFILWANVHGGFAIGIGILLIVLTVRTIQHREQGLNNALLLLLCLGATYLNPFGTRLWGEFWMQLSDTSLRWSIQEWYPAIYYTNIAFWIYAMLSVFLVIRYWKKFELAELVLYVLLFASGLSSMRNIPLFVIVSFAMTVRGIGYLAQEASAYKYGTERFKKAYLVFLFICFGFFVPQLGLYFYGVSIQGSGDPNPTTAVSYLQSHMPEGQLFSSYDWGGYLILALPQKKVFIDGRMPSWRYAASPPVGESNYAFEDYRSVLTDKIAFAVFAKKYHIDTVMLPTGELHKENFKIFGIDVDKSSLLRSLFTSQMSFSVLVPQMKAMGWSEVYHDDKAVIFASPHKGES